MIPLRGISKTKNNPGLRHGVIRFFFSHPLPKTCFRRAWSKNNPPLTRVGIFCFALRRERDSNPRCPEEHNGFRDRPVRPLRHLSWLSAKIEFLCDIWPIKQLPKSMHRNFFLSRILIVLFALSSCNSSELIITDEVAYIETIQEWQHQRVERLKSKDGWLNLAGLFWIEEGMNSFGSDPSNDIIFPEKAAAFCGTLTRNGEKFSLQVAYGVKITSGDTLVKNLDLNHDHSELTSYLEQGELAWHVVKRGDKFGVRMRDYKHPRIEVLDFIPSYPIQTDYVVEATLKPFDEPRTMILATPVEGFTEEYQCPGELHFTLNKEDVVLYPFSMGRGYFLVIADETTGKDTYGAGRFMYSMPDSTGRIILDFNKAYNPPCAFSPFATCPMPPRENFLAVAIEAGEKSVHFD